MGLSVDVEVRRGTFQLEASFVAEAGETVALLGPNGSGKSTLVSTIAGVLPPVAGTVELDDAILDDAHVHVAAEHRPVGVVFQDLLLFPHMTAVENVAFPLRARGRPRPEARAAARRLLDRLGVADRADARPAELSGGEAQRVALARALVARPAVLLLDEPLSALDAVVRPMVRDLVRRELQEFPGTRLVVTHDVLEASMLADRLVLLERGRVTQIGTPEEIRAAPRSRYAADLVGVNAFRGRLVPADHGTGRLVVDGGEVVVAWPAGLDEDATVAAILRPSAVTVSAEPPSGSARNVFRGSVASVANDGERVRVRIASEPPLVAELTVGSFERLGLREGRHVWASFKAVDVDVVPS